MGFYLQEIIPMMDSEVCTPTFTNSFFIFPDWASVSASALAASIFLLAFLYMLASFFQNQQAVARIKIEIYEFFVTSAIFIVLFMMLNGMCSIDTGWLYPEAGYEAIDGSFVSWADESIYYSSMNYLNNFADYSLKVMSLQYWVYSGIDELTSVEIAATPMGAGATLKPLSGLGAVLKPVLNNAFIAEAIGVITTEAQVYVFDYGSYGLLKYFLPIGLVLRCFTVTRRIGGTIIALTVAFLFIYPFLIIPTYMAVNDSLFQNISYVEGDVFADLLASTGEFSTFLTRIYKLLYIPNLAFGWALAMMPMIAKIFLGAVFMPLFNTIILVTTVKYLSRTMGEEIDITNLTRMI